MAAKGLPNPLLGRQLPNRLVQRVGPPPLPEPEHAEANRREFSGCVKALRDAVDGGYETLLRLVLADLESKAINLTSAEIGDMRFPDGLVLLQHVALTGNRNLFHWVVDNGYGCSKDAVAAEARELVTKDSTPEVYTPSYYSTLTAIRLLKEKHLLTGERYCRLFRYTLQIPGAVLSFTSAVLAFLSSALPVSPARTTGLFIAIGLLAIVSAAIQTWGDKLAFQEKGLEHKAASSSLSTIISELEFASPSEEELRALPAKVIAISKECQIEIMPRIGGLLDELVGELQDLRDQASTAAQYAVSEHEAADKFKTDVNSVSSAIQDDNYWPLFLCAQSIKRAVRTEFERDVRSLLSSRRSAAQKFAKNTCDGNGCCSCCEYLSCCNNADRSYDLLVLFYTQRANPEVGAV